MRFLTFNRSPIVGIVWFGTSRLGSVTDLGCGEFTVNEVAGVSPKLTAVVPVKSLPVIVMGTPPVAVSLNGETKLIAGAA